MQVGMQVEKMRKALEALQQTVNNRGGENLHGDFDDVMEAWQDLVESLPEIRTTASFMQSLVSLVVNHINYDDVAESLDAKRVAQHIRTSDVAAEIDLRGVVDEIDLSDVAKQLDQTLLADKVFDRIKNDDESMDAIVTTVRRAIQHKLRDALQG